MDPKMHELIFISKVVIEIEIRLCCCDDKTVMFKNWTLENKVCPVFPSIMIKLPSLKFISSNVELIIWMLDDEASMKFPLMKIFSFSLEIVHCYLIIYDGMKNIDFKPKFGEMHFRIEWNEWNSLGEVLKN